MQYTLSQGTARAHRVSESPQTPDRERKAGKDEVHDGSESALLLPTTIVLSTKSWAVAFCILFAAKCNNRLLVLNILWGHRILAYCEYC